MSTQPTTDDVRDIWVDYHLNHLPRAEGITWVPEYQAAFDAWLETIRADERARMAHLARVVPGGGIRDVRGEIETLRDIADREYEQSDYRDMTAHGREVAYATVLTLMNGEEK